MLSKKLSPHSHSDLWPWFWFVICKVSNACERSYADERVKSWLRRVGFSLRVRETRSKRAEQMRLMRDEIKGYATDGMAWRRKLVARSSRCKKSKRERLLPLVKRESEPELPGFFLFSLHTIQCNTKELREPCTAMRKSEKLKGWSVSLSSGRLGGNDNDARCATRPPWCLASLVVQFTRTAYSDFKTKYLWLALVFWWQHQR